MICYFNIRDWLLLIYPNIMGVDFKIDFWILTCDIKFFLTRIEGPRTEGVIHSTAHWSNVIVILGYITKTDLIWFDLFWHFFRHPSIFIHFSGVGLQWQQAEEGIPDAPFPSNTFQLLLGDPEVFQSPMKCYPASLGAGAHQSTGRCNPLFSDREPWPQT